MRVGYNYLHILILFNFDYYFLIERNVEEYLYLSYLLGVIKRFQKDLFDTVYNWSQIVLKHVWVYWPFSFAWWTTRHLHWNSLQFAYTILTGIIIAVMNLYVLVDREKLRSYNSLIEILRIKMFDGSFGSKDSWYRLSHHRLSHHLRIKAKLYFLLSWRCHIVRVFVILVQVFVQNSDKIPIVIEFLLAKSDRFDLYIDF